MITKKMILKGVMEVISFSLFFLFIATGLVAFRIYRADKKLEGRIYPNVFINNIDFGLKKKVEVSDYFAKNNQKLKKIYFNIFYQGNKVASVSGKALNLHYNPQALAKKAYLIGRNKNLSVKIKEQISTLTDKNRFNINAEIDYDRVFLLTFFNNLEETYNQPAKNALFKFKNGKVVSFRKEKNGIQLKKEKFFFDTESSVLKLKKNIDDQIIYIQTEEIKPETKLSEINSFNIEEIIGVGKSDFSHSSRGRIENIILASSKFNGVLIPKNSIFSFDKTVGDISSLTGYKQAYIIKEGKTILGDGGGVCQVSTTFFRAALNSGLPIVERHAHAYRVHYYEQGSKAGFDATIYVPTVDLKIKNDTPTDILIQVEVDKKNHLLYFYFYGKKDERKIKISEPKIWGVLPPPPPLYQDDPNLKKGIKKQIDFSSWGAKAKFDYEVTKNNQVLFRKTFFSNYKPWRAVYLVGTKE